MLEYQSDAQRGNLLGIQPFVTTADYVSEEAFSARLGGYMEMARQRGWLNERTIVVWPEYLGAWLVSAGESPRLYQAPSLASAMRALALSHVFPFALGVLTAAEKDKVAASFFRLKAGLMADLYQAVFSGLARKYSVTLVAGSILLPSPQVRQGRVLAGRGPLHNVCAVYGPDGQAYTDLVRKSVPTAAELPFIAPAPVSQLPVFETPAGRLGVLICADSWYPAPYERLRAQKVELLAVPSCITERGKWDQPWKGYDGAPVPKDVDLGDLGRLTEGQAWRKYALAGRISQAGARYGINVFLRGSLWDLATDGSSMMTAQGGTPIEAQGGRAALLNLWIR
jgi:predicted amidohydrolase